MTRATKPSKRRPKTLAEALGEVVTELRLKRNWTQEQLGEKAGYSHTQIGNIETSRQTPRYRLIVGLSHAFGMRPSTLIARAEKKQSKN